MEEDALPRFVTSELEQRRKEREVRRSKPFDVPLNWLTPLRHQEVQQLLARASALHQLRRKEDSERKQKMERL